MIVPNIPAFFVGAVIGVAFSFGILVFLRRNRIIEKKTDPIYYRIFSRKKEDLRKIVEYLEKNKKITNDDVQELTKMSDTVTKRYLDELERGNVIVQVGKVGRSVYYILKN